MFRFRVFRYDETWFCEVVSDKDVMMNASSNCTGRSFPHNDMKLVLCATL